MTTTARVRCNGARHEIAVTPSGALVLRNHNLSAEKALIALGGSSCRCLQVLDAWKRQNRNALPAGLKAAFDAARSKPRFRTVPDDPLLIPFQARAAARVTAVAEKTLADCVYRRSQSSWAGGEHIVSARIGQPDISGHGERVWSANGKWPGTNSCITATVPLTWFIRVYRRGLAVVNGCFVLDVISEDAKGLTVLAGRQGRGFDVYPARARIVQTEDGRRLRWLKEGK